MISKTYKGKKADNLKKLTHVAKSLDPEKEAREHRIKTLKSISEVGVAPPDGSESPFIMASGKKDFAVDREHLIPVGAPYTLNPTIDELEEGIRQRNKIGFEHVFTIDSRESCFQTRYDSKTDSRVNWNVALNPDEKFLRMYKTPVDKDGKPDKKKRCTDKDLTIIAEDHELNFPEFLAALVGGKTQENCTAFFCRFILGLMHDEKTGSVLKLNHDREQWDAEDKKLYEDQRRAFKSNISKLILLYPYQLDPVHGLKGSVYKIGSIKQSLQNDPNSKPSSYKPYEYQMVHKPDGGVERKKMYIGSHPKLAEKYAPQLCMQVTVTNGVDKKLEGPHDRIRLIPLSTVCVSKVLEINEKYELGFEVLTSLDPIRKTSSLSLSTFRDKYRQDIDADPPDAPETDPGHICNNWLELMQWAPFRKPWVKPRNWTNGCEPISETAIPLERNRPEHLNGDKFPNLLKIHNKDHPRYHLLNSLLSSINDVTLDKKRKCDDTDTKQIDDLTIKLTDAQKELAEYKQKYEDLVTNVGGPQKKMRLADGDVISLTVPKGRATIELAGSKKNHWHIEQDEPDATNPKHYVYLTNMPNSKTTDA